ncbi:hypothetical protein CTI14_71795, partial [Methylobacterium radiotolerans]
DYSGGRISTGQILFRGSDDREVDLTQASDEQMRMRLTDYSGGRISTGQILFRGSDDREVDLTQASDEQMR